jgi:formate C-acetyltransferase
MRDNHRDKALRARLRSVPAWGNDSPAADRWASALLEARERAQKRVAGELGLAPWQVCHVVRSLHRLDGKQLPASADGRRAGEPVGDSLGAVTDRARQGPTALLNSVARIASPRFYPGGYNLNLTLPLGETKADAVLSLIEGFFAQGGQELQIAALDAEVLKDAQRFPERHKDLLVRIAGFSAVFVQLSRAEQDELIARAAAPAGGPT